MRQRVISIKYLTTFLVLKVFAFSAVAQDSGYKEALEYFKHRKLASEKTKAKTNFFARKKKSSNKQNYFSLGFNLSNLNADNDDYFGGHISYIKKTQPFLRQTISVEYEALAESDKFSFFHSIYYDRYRTWGPEVAIGAGRLYESDFDSSFVAFKAGISFIDLLGDFVDLRIYYKQEVYFKNSLQSEGIGASLFLKL